ncbi:phosphopantetheine-binding protein, partial [Streptomyces sp. NPDC127100]|uniref:phosphopantetheine-binding protein n=1 Tax=Streptomyces sp. NPDC127100 TaxID=3347138 RepID=UPI003655CAD1
ANTFLDALATHRHTHNQPATSLAWGLWHTTSEMTQHMSATDALVLARNGVLPMSEEEGLALFDQAIASGEPVVVPAPINTSQVRARLEAGDAVSPLLQGLVKVRPRLRTAATAADSSEELSALLPQRLAQVPAEERLPVLLDFVREQAASILGLDGVEAVVPHRGLLDLGFDSLTAVELRNRLGRAAGLRLPTTLVFDHPTAQGIASYLLGQLALDEEAGSGSPRSLLDGVASLEAALLSAEPDDTVREELAARLQSLLLGLTDGGGATAARIGEASDDEIFEFIDNELGL